MTKRLISFVVLVCVGVSVAIADSRLSRNAGEPSFSRDVRPILSSRCFACHGFDAEARRADLRLDTFAGATSTEGGRAAVIPGDAENSELWRRISSADEYVVMPPPESKKVLTDAEKDILRQWIATGAKYERHWSFAAPRHQPLPAVNRPEWCRNPIDRFILARLEREGLSPSRAANRETLIRRVTLDLTGLPPTPDDVDAFVQDSRDDAYERLVDRLMTTTAYAERRAQDWLDLARYADTRGFADDQMREIWPFRDWVVRAINRNMPFDQFTVEQLAGDMLPDATIEQRLASAFHRNAPQARGMTYPVEEFRVKGVIDRVNTTGRVWLGLTMACAECHDHKFDPISQADYYSMLALFNNVEHSGQGFGQGGPTMSYLPAPLARERSRIVAKLAAARENSSPLRFPDDNEGLLETWDGPAVTASAVRFSVTGDFSIAAMIRTTQPVADIVSKYDWRGRQRSFVFGIGGEGEQNSVPGHLFVWISAKREPFDGVEVYGSRKVNDGRDHQVAVVFEAGKSVRLFVDGVEDTAARVRGIVPKSTAVSDRRLAIGAGYTGTPEPNAFRFEGKLTDVRLYDRAVAEADPIVAKLAAELGEFDEKNASVAAKAVPVMRERSTPRDTFIHIRGNFLDRGARVLPAVPVVLDVSSGRQPVNRLEFARWLVDGNNPLVARVAVNRFWQSCFGLGLVRTSDDFGTQGSASSHPELLDRLALEFVDSGWDMKQMHRLIVTSATYRQSTRVTPELRRRDPDNRLLARMPRVRLSAEQIRDQALAVSGLLVDTPGGPPVFPDHPENYWTQRALPGKWTTSTGDGRYRRTLYTYWRRMALHPSLELLDAPARETCVARRGLSNVPTQALVLLNDPIFNKAAQALARRLVREVDDDDTARLERAFRLVLGRLPDNSERTRFLSFVAHERGEFQSDRAAAANVSGAEIGSDFAGQAAWTLACSVLLNLDEAITRP